MTSLSIETQLTRCDLGIACYYAAFAVFLFEMLLGWSTYRWVDWFPAFKTIAQVLIVCLLILNLVIRENLLRRIATMLPFLIVAFISWRVSGSNYLAWLTLMVAFAGGTDARMLARIAIVVYTFGACFIVFSSQSGIISALTGPSFDGLRTRYALGFIGPNRSAVALLVICLSLCIIRFEKANPIPELTCIVICLAITEILFISRAVEIMLLLMLVLYPLFKHMVRAGKSKRLAVSCLIIVAIGIGASLVLMVFYSEESPMLSDFNKMLSGRLRFSHHFYETYSVGAFGYDYSDEPIVQGSTIDHTEQRFLVDNSYCHILLHFGIVPFIMFALCVLFAFVDSIRTGEFDGCMFGLFAMLMYSLAETAGFMFDTNYCIVAITYAVVRFRESQLTGRATLSCGHRQFDRAQICNYPNG